MISCNAIVQKCVVGFWNINEEGQRGVKRVTVLVNQTTEGLEKESRKGIIVVLYEEIGNDREAHERRYCVYEVSVLGIRCTVRLVLEFERKAGLRQGSVLNPL